MLEWAQGGECVDEKAPDGTFDEKIPSDAFDEKMPAARL